jgi:DNA mismatch endonuclease Vsr
MREHVVPIGPRKLSRIAPRRLRPPLTRSEMMGRVRSKDAKPELKTRSAVHALGRRFRIHVGICQASPISPTRRGAGQSSFTAASGTLTRTAGSHPGHGRTRATGLTSSPGIGSEMQFTNKPSGTLAMRF